MKYQILLILCKPLSSLHLIVCHPQSFQKMLSILCTQLMVTHHNVYTVGHKKRTFTVKFTSKQRRTLLWAESVIRFAREMAQISDEPMQGYTCIMSPDSLPWVITINLSKQGGVESGSHGWFTGANFSIPDIAT